jgi:RNA polymerase sigma-70 factor (ECF subfamily)
LKIIERDFEDFSEEDLLARFIEGEPRALEALIQRREKWLYNVAKKTVRDKSLAEEALQEALISICKNAHTFRGDSQVSSWMYQIVTHACFDVLRKEKVRAHLSIDEFDSPDLIGGVSTFEGALLDQLLIHSALLQIEPQHKEVITLLDLEGRSVQEVGEMLGVPAGTVKSRAARGRLALKEVLQKIVSENWNQTERSNVIPLGVKNARKQG